MKRSRMKAKICHKQYLKHNNVYQKINAIKSIVLLIGIPTQTRSDQERNTSFLIAEMVSITGI